MPSAPKVSLVLVLFASLALVAAPPARAGGMLVVTDAGPGPTPPEPRRPLRPPEPRREPVATPLVSLEGHRVHATIDGRVADVTVEQTFRSHADRVLEGSYLFPLPEGAAVQKFQMTMGGKMVAGEVVEADEARRIYQEIVNRRRDPGLLEYVGRGLFRARVFPIEPRQDLTIRLSFQQILPEDAGTLEFRYPLATDRFHAEPVANVLVDVKIRSDVDLKAIYSPSHDVAVVRDGNRKAEVSYERSGRRQEQDFLLYVGRSPEDVGFSLVSNRGAGEDGTFLAVFAPKTSVTDAERAPKDVVYVLDTSGSMAQDGKLDQARRALAYGIRTLRPGDRLNVIAFATQVRPFRDGVVDATPEVRAAAIRWIDELEPAGGTNIEGALQAALAAGRGDRLRLVVFLTDGRPTIGSRDPDAIARLAETKGDQPVRVFTFGVGYDLDVRLLDRIAEATHAARDYVTPGEDLELATSRFFRKVSEPVLTDVELDLGSGVYDVYPSRLPDLFAGEQVVVLGRYHDAGDRVVTLRGRVGDREVRHEYEGTFAGGERAAYLPRLWAHRKVGYLLDEIRLHGEDKELVAEIVRLATRYGIVTPYTAGLVLEEGEAIPRFGLAGGTGGRDRGGDVLERLHLGLLGGAAGAPAPGGSAAPTDALPRPAAPAEREARDSKALQKLKDGAKEPESKEDGLDEVRARVETVADKTFLLDADGRWVDTAYDHRAETRKVEAFSDAWTALLASLEKQYGEKVLKYVALGDRVVFVLGGQAYEVVP